MLDGVVQHYAWGSLTAIPELLGTMADGNPQAELWLGAHPSAPAGVGGVGLDQVIAADPLAALGAGVVERFGPRLPFLLKILAAAQPLSLQAHPSTEQALAGFALESAAGIPLNAPHRRYRDATHKPELLYALTPVFALCGFRPIVATLALLDRLGLSGHPVFSLVGTGDLHGTVRGLLSLAGAERAEVAETIALASAAGAPSCPEAAWAVRCAAIHPGDPGVGVALLLNLVTLEPGEAIYLPAGNLHAYLEGVGVEIMASSDNVLRGGLTEKYVDVEELLAVLDCRPGPPPIIQAVTTGAVHRYPTPVPEFDLSVIDLAEAPVVLPGGHPRIVLCLAGTATLSVTGGDLSLPKGIAAWVPAADGPVSLTGAGQVAMASTP